MMSSSALFSEVLSSPYSCDALVACQVQSSRYKRKACRVIVSGLLDMMRGGWHLDVKFSTWNKHRGIEPSRFVRSNTPWRRWWMDVVNVVEYFHIRLARATTPHSKRAGVWCISTVRRPQHENVSRQFTLREWRSLRLNSLPISMSQTQPQRLHSVLKSW